MAIEAIGDFYHLVWTGWFQVRLNPQLLPYIALLHDQTPMPPKKSISILKKESKKNIFNKKIECDFQEREILHVCRCALGTMRPQPNAPTATVGRASFDSPVLACAGRWWLIENLSSSLKNLLIILPILQRPASSLTATCVVRSLATRGLLPH